MEFHINANVPRRFNEFVEASSIMLDWDAEVERRVGFFLDATSLKTMLMIVPTASGDIALTTTAVREIMTRNPDCKITLAVRQNLRHIAMMCPGVASVINIPFEDKWDQRSLYLRHYSGQADAVVCVSACVEDMDLLLKSKISLVDTIWLLSGLPRPSHRLKIWLESDPFHNAAIEKRRQPLLLKIGELFRFPSLKNTLRFKELLLDVNKTIIISTSASTLGNMPDSDAKTLVDTLHSLGYRIYHSVRDELEALPGTMPLVCSHEEFLWLRQKGIRFVGWRSGLCDIAAASSTPMLIFSPKSCSWDTCLESSFGFKSMNIDCNCDEIFLDEGEALGQLAITSFLR